MKILIVEDDPLVSETLTSILSQQNYVMEVAQDGRQGLELATAFTYDLIVLDIMLPKMDGITLCRQLRSQNIQTPLMLLTARDSSHDKAVGLDAGADDYMVKPFDNEELVARVRALMRRSGEASQPILCWGDLHLDPGSCEVRYADRLIPVTPKEYALLELFLRNPKRVFSCSSILDHLWSYEEAPGEEAVRTHIKGLRQKLKKSQIPSEVIETVYGIGYRLKPWEATNLTSAEPTPPSPSMLQTQAAVQKIWEQSQPRIREQMTTIKQAIAALEKNKLTEEVLNQAIQNAHTLAGSLGMFGFSQGSTLAQQLERLLKQYQSDPHMVLAKSLRPLFKALQQILQGPVDRPLASPTVMPACPDAADKLEEDESMVILVISQDTQLPEALAAEATHLPSRIKIQRSGRLQTARKHLYQHAPQAIVLDLEHAAEYATCLTFLTELHEQAPSIPVVVLAAHHDLQERLEVMRSGARAFLPKPTSAQDVMKAITQVLNHVEKLKSHVLVVDDDPSVLSVVQNLLQPWGFRVTTLQNPQQFWQILESDTPDILILDVMMPGVNGIELCQTVRNDPHWSDLPILFLTAHKDAETINQVYSSGGDDFVSKPIIGPELVTRVVNRLERIKLLQRRYPKGSPN
ncbi:response regulator [Alkalinema sp. FACHB-956]|uniref:response regulator n=1 Tax=Alkalinema sp. FACHB-956 TaxID=2692768 RepID=UPI001687A7F2|nr:response regulator [Alkalinema sp. FACHB-956]MBD2327912.1 response regulator [Alkalinema sp. FACHB-956]